MNGVFIVSSAKIVEGIEGVAKKGEELGNRWCQGRLERERQDWGVYWSVILERVRLLAWRNERWVKRICRETMCNLNGLSLEHIKNKCGWVYILCNTRTKKVYVGETKESVYERFARHLRDARNQVGRQCYNYMKRVGLSEWLMVPLMQNLGDTCLRKREERRCMHLWWAHLINDPCTWKGFNITRKVSKGQVQQVKRQQVQKRVDRGLLIESLRGEKWKEMNSDTASDTVVLLTRHMLPKQLKTRMIGYLKRWYAKEGIKFEREYRICVDSGIGVDRRKIKRAIVEGMQKDVLGRWVVSRLQISVRRTIDLRRIIGNRQRWKKKIAAELHGCECDRWYGLKKCERHIVCKDEDIGDRYMLLKRMLSVNNKTPVMLVEGERWGVKMTALVLTKMEKYGVCMKLDFRLCAVGNGGLTCRAVSDVVRKWVMFLSSQNKNILVEHYVLVYLFSYHSGQNKNILPEQSVF